MSRKRVDARLFAFVCLYFVAALVRAATITVNSTADAIGDDGQCTLREAMIAANTNTPSGAAAGECAAGSAGMDVIAFSIAGTGVRTLTVLSRLPTPTEPVTIDGYTQPGASANSFVVGNNAVLLVEIDGSSLPPAESLFVLGPAGATTVRGLVINRVRAPSFLIGPLFLGSSSGNTIAGNFIGTDPSGTLLQDAGVGPVIVIETAQSRNNMIGGATPDARNVMPGGGASGGSRITIRGANNSVQGNYIGTNASGNAALLPGTPTNAIGLDGAAATGNLIGGPSAGMGNVIVATGEGISLTEASGNTIQGNLIGTNAEGGVPLGGGGTSAGIATHSGASGNVIGGRGSQGNVISGFRNGIRLQEGPLSATIRGNRIGTDVTGTLPIPNIQTGITINAGGPGVIGGDPALAEGNIIAFNGIGILFESLSTNTGWAILGNSIFANQVLGISFGGGATPTPNDDQDLDAGPNNLQNYPVLQSVAIVGSVVTLSGSLNSAPNSVFRIEFFASPACDGSGYGEGQTFIGATLVQTNGEGNASFSNLTFPSIGGPVITATATIGTGGSSSAVLSETSEFSACVIATIPAPPTIAKSFGGETIRLNGSGTLSFSVANQTPGAGVLTGVAFTDILPPGLIVSTPNGIVNTCGGVVNAISGGGSIGLSGATLAGGASCSVTVNVTGTSVGRKVNTVSVRANESGPGNTASATVTVIAPPVIVNAFGVPSLVLGTTTDLRYSITNPNPDRTLSGVGFIDVLTGGLVVATPNGLSDGCSGGTVTAVPGSNSISLNGATLGPGESCVFGVNVTATETGHVVETTGTVISNEGGAGPGSIAGIVVILEQPSAIPTLDRVGLLLLLLLLSCAAAIVLVRRSGD